MHSVHSDPNAESECPSARSLVGAAYHPKVDLLGHTTNPLTDGEMSLRPFNLGDVAVVTQACQDPEISRWTATIPSPYTEDDARSWILTHNDLWGTGAAAHFAITTPAGEFLGALGLQPIDWERRSAVVGYWVAAWARRRGIATRALRLVAPWAFDVVGLTTLELHTKIGNVGSERVAEKAGFEMFEVVENYPHPMAAGQHHHVKRWQLHARERD
jgi:RimJ/RimL family protein N-acetyltransferase